MASKDYYAILMVHPKAEKFLIEAAYKRLVREYHPDVNNTSNTHEKMVDINEAYDVLSDPVRRRAYEAEWARGSAGKLGGTGANGATGQPASANTRASASPSAKVAPMPPDPTQFGINPGYLERAIEGARLWKKRQPRLPERSKWLIRVVCGITGLIISLSLSHTGMGGFGNLARFAWLGLLIAGETTIRVLEWFHDARLKREVFNRRYNPNANGYAQYAVEYARYETAITNVYVSGNGLYHSKPVCSGVRTSYTMPMWAAAARDNSACPQCGHFVISPRRLPPPFNDFLRWF